MAYDATENVNDSNNEQESLIDIKTSEIKDAKVRKRIDDLLEKKRLRDQLDDTEDW